MLMKPNNWMMLSMMMTMWMMMKMIQKNQTFKINKKMIKMK